MSNPTESAAAASGAVAPPAPRRPGVKDLLSHPAHLVAFGFGSGLSPVAPGTVGTLWAWLSFAVLWPWLGVRGWGVVVGLSLPLGVWACTVAARRLRAADPGAIVWDEIVAFWLVLWVLMPISVWEQFGAFVLFRALDALKPGPVGWADRLVGWRAGEAIGWRHGAGILVDDLVAALTTLVVLAAAVRAWAAWSA